MAAVRPLPGVNLTTPNPGSIDTLYPPKNNT